MYVFVCVSWENLLPIFQVEHPCAQSSKVELSFVKEKEKENGDGLRILHLQEAVNGAVQEPQSKTMHKKADEELGVFLGFWVMSMNNSSLQALKWTQLPGFPDN